MTSSQALQMEAKMNQRLNGGARGGVTFTPKSNLNLHQGGTLFWREAITFLSKPWEFR